MPRSLLVLLACASLLVWTPDAHAQDAAPRVVAASRVNTSAPLRDLPVRPGNYRSLPPYVVPNKIHTFGGAGTPEDRPGFTDPVLDAGRGGVGPGTVVRSFDGVSENDNAVVAQVVVPPDPNGDVGPNHYVQWANLSAMFFDKAGNLLLGPVPGNFFFQGLGGPCESQNDGDPVILYDHLADRWVAMQFLISFGNALCLAVSETPDPTGAYHQYQFPFNNFPDYPKLGVWPDAYYATTRSFGSSFRQEAVAFERAKMLQGQPANMVVFLIPRNNNGSNIDGFLPADLDGPAPPSGTPGLFVGGPVTTPNQLRIYGLRVNWANPSAATFTLLNALTPAAYDQNLGDVPQPSPGERLATLTFTLMHRVQYRNFGSRQTLVLNHTVDAGGDRAGVRWYELRNAAGNTGSGWSIYQQGTYAPNDGLERWMASAALNGNGDLGLAYAISGTNLFPSIRFTGQTAEASGSGAMNVAETTILTGTGAQTNSFNRWGDYSMLAVDPSDDRTFWYTQEYYQTTSSFNFRTRIAAFTLPSEGVSLTAENTTSLTVPPGGSVEFSYTVTNGTGATAVGDLFYTAVRNGSTVAQGVIASGSLPPGQSLSGTYTQNVPGSAPAGTYTYTLRIGQFPGATLDSRAFTVTVTPTAREGGADAWAVREATPWVADAPAEAALRGEDAQLAGLTLAAYPNPFVAATTLGFALPEATEVTLDVLDVLGRRVALVAEGEREAGPHRVAFDASSLPSGAYLVRLVTGTGAAETQRITLLR